jgi:hypothetical protein
MEKMPTYIEHINRYRILRHEELPEAHKAEYRLSGIEPDDLWSLIWSFNDEAEAIKCLAEYNDRPDKPSFYTYKMVDAGKEEDVERVAWL